ncbi:MAG TPA: ROK family protein [Pyrinomonadaceae bacterium]|nr:ROK family protein [Pyrinomonadaceae bacterium]
MGENPDLISKTVGVEASTNAFLGVCIDQNNEVASLHRGQISRDESPAEQLIAFIGSLKERFGDFDRIGVAVPGLIEKGNKRVAFSAHIPEHAAVDLTQEIASAHGIAATIENDANAAAYGEFKLGSGQGSRNLFYATLGEGVGGAFIIDGEIWRGNAGFAGEFGYVAINSDGMRLEDVASTANIVRRTRSRFQQDSTSSLNRIDEQQITIEDIVRAAERQDDFAQLMLQRTGNYVGTAIASVINLLNIETIVIGGEIMRAADLVLDAIIRRARELSFAPSFNSTTIVAGSLGENAAAVGAALLAKNGDQ